MNEPKPNCLDDVEFKAWLKVMRKQDDEIKIMLNKKGSSMDDCENLWQQTQISREIRLHALDYCLSENSKVLPGDLKKATMTENAVDLRKQRVIYERTQFFESERYNENILWNTSVKQFKSRCRGLNITNEFLSQWNEQQQQK